jgi:signal transduction histidine kinase
MRQVDASDLEAALRRLEGDATSVRTAVSTLIEQHVTARTAELQTANERLEAFTHMVAHDLRAPLRNISAYVHLLRFNECAAVAERQFWMDRIGKSLQQADEIIAALTDLTRASGSEIERTAVDLSLIAADCVHDIESAGISNTQFIVESGLTAYAEATLLRIALANLLRNAYKFSAKREQPVVTVGRELQSDGSTAFFVRDNGVGFDTSDALTLFSAFRRLHSAAEFPGTGIGLATVKRIIDRHGGRVWAVGQVGVGATLYFTL